MLKKIKDAIIADYSVELISILKISEKHGVTVKEARKVIDDGGVRMSAKQRARQHHLRKIKEAGVTEQQIIDSYESGVSLFDTSQTLSIPITSVRRAVDDNGSVRTTSEAQKKSAKNIGSRTRTKQAHSGTIFPPPDTTLNAIPPRKTGVWHEWMCYE